jgi:hypothetical protein
MHDFAGKVKAAGIDFSKMSPAQQAGFMQAFQFSPNVVGWMRDFSKPSTATRQARVLGDTSVNAMTRYYEQIFGGSKAGPGGVGKAPHWSTSEIGQAIAGGGGAQAALPTMAGDITGSGPSGGRFNVRAGSGQVGQRQTITLANGARVTVNARAAAQFQGFFNDLIAAGAPVHDLGGYGNRPYNPSQHPIGLAIDWSQKGRNIVSRDVQAWISAHPQVLNALEAKWGMSGGEHWGHPDTGHFSIETLFGSEHLAKLRGEGGGKQTEEATANKPEQPTHHRSWMHTDRALRRQHAENVLGTAKVSVDLKNLPRGTKTSVQGDRFFKYVDFNQTRQMPHADDLGHIA